MQKLGLFKISAEKSACFQKKDRVKKKADQKKRSKSKKHWEE